MIRFVYQGWRPALTSFGILLFQHGVLDHLRSPFSWWSLPTAYGLILLHRRADTAGWILLGAEAAWRWGSGLERSVDQWVQLVAAGGAVVLGRRWMTTRSWYGLFFNLLLAWVAMGCVRAMWFWWEYSQGEVVAWWAWIQQWLFEGLGYAIFSFVL